MIHRKAIVSGLALCALTGIGQTQAADDEVVQFGNTPARNMVSSETGVPVKWDMKSGLNIKWTVDLGSQTYAGPVIKDGIVYVGSNNQQELNPKLKGDRGNVMAFNAEDGKLLWQSAHPKLGAGRVNDWPLQGVCSTPAIVGDTVYYMSNRAEVIAADAKGFADGNDGPYKDEENTDSIDEDVIWKYDLIGELDVFPHNLAAGSPLIVGDLIYAITGQGVDEGHVNIPSPDGPSFVAIDRKSGELVWESALPHDKVLHGSWSNPSYGTINGVEQVVFPGGDGWLYSFEPKTGELIWKIDLNPKDSKWILGGRGTKNNVISMAVFYDNKLYIGVGQDPEHGEAPGNFWVLSPKGTGDLTGKAVVWHRGGEDFHRTMSSAAIHDDILYISDLSGFVYALNAQTGEEYWKYDTFAAIWGSPFYVDGKVYIGDEDGDIAVLQAGKKMKLLGEYNMGSAVYTTPVVKDGVMYVASRTKLFALEDGIAAKAPEKPKAAASEAKKAAK